MGFFGNKKKVAEVDTVSIEESKILELIVNILKKENTKVSMAPLSKKYILKNKDIELNILIDGDAELVKTSNHKFKYGWKFRGDFINQLVKIVIDWLEVDRLREEREIFINEINLLNDISILIDKLPDAVFVESKLNESVKQLD